MTENIQSLEILLCPFFLNDYIDNIVGIFFFYYEFN